MGMFDGKKGLILGVANDRSIAWAIAQVIMKEGGLCGFNHLPDKPDDERQRNRRRVTTLTDQYKDQAPFVLPLDVQKDDDIAAFMRQSQGAVRPDRFSAALDRLCHARRLEERHHRDQPRRLQAGDGD